MTGPRVILLAFGFALVAQGYAALAQDDGQSASRAEPTGSIIVEGSSLEVFEETVKSQARATLANANQGIPTPRYFADVCLWLIGFPDDLKEPFEERIRANASLAGAPLARAGSQCAPNAFVSLSPDPMAIIEEARTKQNWMFANARQSVIRRLAKRSVGAISWSLIECRRLDRRPTGEISLNGKPEPRTQFGTCESARDNGGIPPKSRNDIILSVTLLERGLIDGMSIDEVADYATMRMLLLVDPYVASRETPLPSILTLFSEGSANGEGLTEMDWAILRATYQSGPNDTTYATSRETARNLVEGDLSALGPRKEP